MSIQAERLPDRGGIELWLVEGPATDGELAQLEPLLSADERKRLDRFKVERARHSFLVSRGSLRKILSGAIGCAPEEIRLRYGANGKPYLDGDQANTCIQFNVSHSGDLYLYAIGKEHEIGVDVERVNEHIEVEKLARRFFSEEEVHRLLEEAPEKERVASFYRCWTRKEAYLKVRGTGMTINLDQFAVTLLPGEPAALVRTEVPGDDPSNWRLWDIETRPQYKAALIAPAP